MKRTALLLSVIALTLCSSCSKERTCRCSVRGDQTVRIITVKNKKCDDLRFVRYNASILDINQVDSMVCTDFEFAIDSNATY